jgi:hypothetical protein
MTMPESRQLASPEVTENPYLGFLFRCYSRAVIAKLDPFFERTSKLASRRLKRELERRGTLGEPLDGASLFTERIPTEESGSDLFRSDGLAAAAALSCHAEPPQSVVQCCPAQGSAVWPGEKES